MGYELSITGKIHIALRSVIVLIPVETYPIDQKHQVYTF